MTNWYALQVQCRSAKIASATLNGKGYEEFLPLYRARRRWSDRVKEVEVPLFPGYLFCRFDPSDRLVPVLTTPGVIGIVGAGGKALEVAEDEIESVKKIVSSGLAAQPWPFLSAGCRISIERGPLTGLEGIVVSDAGIDQVVVSVSLLQRSIAVEIERDWARRIPSPPAFAAGKTIAHSDPMNSYAFRN